MIDLNDLLRKENIDPKSVIVMRHRPNERSLNRMFRWIASERPDLYNAYQSTQAAKCEGALKKAKYVASFVAYGPGKALFVGFYSQHGWKPITHRAYWRKPEYAELKMLGMQGFAGERPHILYFDLKRENFYSEWSGRLVVHWPAPEISWWRWADRNRFEIHAVSEENVLREMMPNWDQIDISWQELRNLPQEWKNALRQWRGIYFIFDKTVAKGYVGAAYGSENILGRWQNYASTGHGGNKELRKRDPENFRFTILERVSPDLPAQDIQRIEAFWKIRLHTQTPFGLNDN